MSDNSYYVEGLYYTTLEDVLSDGWPEDQIVEVWDQSKNKIISRPAIAELRRTLQPAPAAQLRRVVAVANESYAERTPSGGVRYALALITEDEPGWSLGGWYSDLQEAQDAADSYNRVAGHSRDTVLDVQVSSMRAGRVR